MSKAKDLAGFVSTGGILADGTVNLTSEVTGTLPIASGGTNATTADGALTALGGTSVGTSVFKAVDAAAARTALGAELGTVTSVGGTGTVNGLSLSGTVTTSGNLTLGGTLSGVDLTSQVTGTLPVANGGTGITSAGTAGNVLVSDGTNWASTTLNLSSVEPPYNSIAPIIYPEQPNLIQAQGGTWLKTGVVAPAATYPNVLSAPFIEETPVLTSTYPISATQFPAYGASKWVYPVTGGFMVSPDLFTWEFIAQAGVTTATQLAYINSKFVAILPSSTTVVESANGTTWTSANTMPQSGNWCRPIWTGTRYITGNASTTHLAYSTDLTTWTLVDVGNAPASIGWNGSRVVVGCSGNTIKSSTNQTSYSSYTISQGNAASALTYSSVAWNGSRWVAVSDGVYDSGYSYIYQWSITSTTGTSWGSPAQTMTIYGGRVSAIGSTFYIISQQSAISSDYNLFGYKSTNGSTWTRMETQYVNYRTFPPRGSGGGVVATDGSTYVIGSSVSTDSGTSWGSVYLNFQSYTPARIAYANNTYIMAMFCDTNSASSTHFGQSTNGIDWHIKNGPQGNWTDIVYFNGKWIMGSDNRHRAENNSAALYSSDLVTWNNTTGSPQGKLTVAGDYVFCAYYYTSSSTAYTYSSDGISYSTGYLSTSGGQAFFAYGNGVYAGTNKSGAVCTSTNASSWTQRSISADGNPVGIFFAYGAFWFISQTGTVYKSTDSCVTWSTVQVLGSKNDITALTSASFDGTNIVATQGGNRTYLITNNGTAWYWRSLPASQPTPYSSVANGVISTYNAAQRGAKIGGNYVFNDVAQYASISTSALGTPMYMRVE